METFPEFNLFPRVQKVIDGVKRIAMLDTQTELWLSEHKRGAAEMLDSHLDYQPELPLEVDYGTGEN